MDLGLPDFQINLCSICVLIGHKSQFYFANEAKNGFIEYGLVGMLKLGLWFPIQQAVLNVHIIHIRILVLAQKKMKFLFLLQPIC